MDERLREVCRSDIPAQLLAAQQLYWAGRFFECHEVLEELWRETEGPLRELYRGLIQVVVGIYHLHRGNLVGARNLLARGLARVERYPSPCVGLDLEQFCRGVCRLLAWVEGAGTGETPDLPVWR